MDEDIKVLDTPLQTREALIVPDSFNEADNTVDVVWTTGSCRRAYDWYNGTYYDEELEVTRAAVDMTRFDAGTVQVLDGHNTYGGVRAILGVAMSASVEAGEGRAKLKLSVDPAKAGVVADIKAGVIRAISFGYSVLKYVVTEAKARADKGTVPLYRATKWQPHEISFVPVGADPNASTRSMDAQGKPIKPEGGNPCEYVYTRAAAPITPQESTMTEEEKRAAAEEQQRQADQAAAQQREREAAAAEATRLATARAADITAACQRAGFPQLAEAFVRDAAVTINDVNARLLTELVNRDAAGGVNALRISNGSQDEHTTRMQGMAEVVGMRMSGNAAGLTDNGRQFTGMSLIEMGRELLLGLGVNTRGMNKMQIAAAMLQTRSGAGMMTVSDFPSLMSNVANKRLRAGYEENPGTYRQWARRAPSLPDFKSVQVTQFSAMPDLLQTNEHGEFKYGSVSDGAVTYNLLTYGRILTMTRQAIINDDLRAFDRIVSGFGASAARLENRTVYAQITSNPTMVDSVALFHATHGNLSATAAIDVTSLTDGRKKMRKQKGLQNEELNLAPAYLLVPTDLEQVAYQYTSANYVPATAANINEFRAGGRTAITPIVEPILDAASASQWYLAAQNSQVDTVEYAYLEGAEGVQTDMEVGFEVDGISIKARLDFVSKVIDYRGLFRNG